jgi:hypothetical protein
VDGQDNLWVANFGPLQPRSNFTDGRISELCGINRAACPPGKKLGDPISPPTGYTVPSAGQQVFAAQRRPVVRSTTSTGRPQLRPNDASNECSDRPGWQHWALNNWKPDFDIDLCCNPGGDGVVIFVDLAAPPISQAP